MPKIKNREFETFNDGILEVCKTESRKITETRQSNIRFGKKTVGIKRFYEAKVASSKVDMLVCIPAKIRVEQSDIILIQSENGYAEQFEIEQIQEKFDTVPPTYYLSLKRNAIRWKDER